MDRDTKLNYVAKETVTLVVSSLDGSILGAKHFEP